MQAGVAPGSGGELGAISSRQSRRSVVDPAPGDEAEPALTRLNPYPVTTAPRGCQPSVMLAVTRLYADEQGHARFEDVEIPLTPDDPPPDVMSVSGPWQASAVVFGRGAAGGSHPDQPEQRRQLVIGLSGTVEVTAIGETRTFGPGDVLLVEDTSGVGHSSRSSEGFVGAFVLLEPSHVVP